MKLHVFSFSTSMAATVVSVMGLTYLMPLPCNSRESALPQQQHVSSGKLIGVQSFSEQKNIKIQIAQSKIKSIKAKISKDPNLINKTNASEAGLSQQLESEILNLSLIHAFFSN